MMYLTFDVGTTSVKTALYDKEGHLLRKVTKDYVLETPRPGWCEVDPEVYWNAVISGFRDICADPKISSHSIESICGCSQGETIILLDEDGRPVRPALVWLDNRAEAEVEELLQYFGADAIYKVCGIPEMGHIWSASKLLWLKKNEFEAMKRTRLILLVEDYISYKLTGKACAVPSLWATTLLLDINKGEYWEEMAYYLDVRDKLPPIVGENVVLGGLQSGIGADLGLDESCIVIKGSMDQNMSALGAGNISPGIVTETTGSALVLAVASDGLPELTLQAEIGNKTDGINCLPIQPHVIPGMYLFMPFSQTAGILYKWFRDTFGGEELRRAGNPDKAYIELNKLAEEVPPGAEGLILLPFFSGGVLPKTSPKAKGVFYGLTLKHGKGHFVRAILEAIGFMLKDIVGVLENSGISVKEIHSMGGGARSDLWLSIKADICGLPVIRMLDEETSTLGTAIVSAVKTGMYLSFDKAVKEMVRTGERFMPRSENRKIYKEAYGEYNMLFNKLYR